MPTAFVTGATGFLGRHIVDILSEKGWDVVAMVRDPAYARRVLSRDQVSLVRGDLTKPNSVADAMPEGVDAVFHAAADTSSWSRDKARLEAVNIGGTDAILTAMALKGAGRLVHVSSISVFGHQDAVVDENSPHLGADSWVDYARTKAMGEARVQARIQEGFDAVIVNPTHIVGRYDTQNWARLISRLAQGDLPGVPSGGGHFANGRKVAEAIVTAYHRAPRGESYILGGPYATMREFIDEAGRQLDIVPPSLTIPAWLMRLLAWWYTLKARITGGRPNITQEEAQFASARERTTSAKAQRDLDYAMVPIAISIQECLQTLKVRVT